MWLLLAVISVKILILDSFIVHKEPTSIIDVLTIDDADKLCHRKWIP